MPSADGVQANTVSAPDTPPPERKVLCRLQDGSEIFTSKEDCDARLGTVVVKGDPPPPASSS